MRYNSNFFKITSRVILAVFVSSFLLTSHSAYAINNADPRAQKTQPESWPLPQTSPQTPTSPEVSLPPITGYTNINGEMVPIVSATSLKYPPRLRWTNKKSRIVGGAIFFTLSLASLVTASVFTAKLNACSLPTNSSCSMSTSAMQITQGVGFLSSFMFLGGGLAISIDRR